MNDLKSTDSCNLHLGVATHVHILMYGESNNAVSKNKHSLPGSTKDSLATKLFAGSLI